MFSPTSIANFLACKHLTSLDRAAAAGNVKRPHFSDPGLDLLIKLGEAHEQRYLQALIAEGYRVANIPTDVSRHEAADATIEAIRSRLDVIYQAAFLGGPTDLWFGRADFLKRVGKPSVLGDWSYEVIETKLARSTKARAIVQLCFYSDLLAQIQGVLPDYMHVVLGGDVEPQKFPLARYI